MIFMSHTQRDKFRPDRRFHELTAFLVSRGLPIWIDKPEELRLDNAELRDRSLQLSGRWTEDIRSALRDCTVGIGVWSVHAADRIEGDPNGVLFQELNSLAVSEKLFLVNLDPQAMVRLPLAFEHLAGNQQCVDLSVSDRTVFNARTDRLASDLSVRLGLSQTLNCEMPSALFSNLDPGVRTAQLSAVLQDALSRQADACRDRNLAVRAFHRLLATFQVPSQFIPDCFDAVKPGLGSKLAEWLFNQARDQHKREQPGYTPVSLTTDDAFEAAARIAEAEGVTEIDERIYFLALATKVESGTVRFLERQIGTTTFDEIIQTVTEGCPAALLRGTGDLEPFGD